MLSRIRITDVELSKSMLLAKAHVMLSVSPHGVEPGDEASHDCILALQVTPCAQSTGTDDPDFTTDKATQTAGVDLIADIIDTAVRIRESGSRKSGSRLQDLLSESRVLESDVDIDCLSDLTGLTAS